MASYSQVSLTHLTLHCVVFPWKKAIYSHSLRNCCSSFVWLIPDSWFCQRGRDLNAKSTGGDAASFQLLQQFALECGTLTPNVCRGNDAPSQQPYCGGKIGYGLVPGPLIFKIGDTPHVTSFFYCVLFLRGPTRHITHTHTHSWQSRIRNCAKTDP